MLEHPVRELKKLLISHSILTPAFNFSIIGSTLIYEIAEKSPRKQFEGSMTMSTAITLWEFLTKQQLDQK
jgi:hypothetical protein